MVPDIGFEPIIVEFLRLLRMPVPPIRLEDRAGIEPTYDVLQAPAFAGRPTVHLVKQPGIEPRSLDLQSIECPARCNILVVLVRIELTTQWASTNRSTIELQNLVRGLGVEPKISHFQSAHVTINT